MTPKPSMKTCLLFVIMTFVSLGCSQDTLFQLMVTNGLLDLGDQSVVMIEGSEPSTGYTNYCTATFVAKDTLLTSAHCLFQKSTNIPRMIKTVGKTPQKMVSYKVHPDFWRSPKTDLAVVKLEKSGYHQEVLPIAMSDPSLMESVRLVGFGGNQYTAERGVTLGRGVKRFGWSKVSHLDSQYIYSKGHRDAMPSGSNRPTGADSALARGDSGGPMLNSRYEILGVASKIHEVENPESPSVSIIVAHSKVAIAHEFIRNSIKELAD